MRAFLWPASPFCKIKLLFNIINGHLRSNVLSFKLKINFILLRNGAEKTRGFKPAGSILGGVAMNKLSRFFVLALSLIFIAGCSVVMATQQPSRMDFSVLSKGVDRSRVIAELGAPLTTDVKDGKRTDVFSVRQGYSTGAKVGRALFHGAADVFTLGLWEVVGTPVEAIASGTVVKVGVTYDKNDRVEEIITYSGKEKVDEAVVPVPAKAEGAKVNEAEKQAQ